MGEVDKFFISLKYQFRLTNSHDKLSLSYILMLLGLSGQCHYKVNPQGPYKWVSTSILIKYKQKVCKNDHCEVGNSPTKGVGRGSRYKAYKVNWQR